MQQEYLSKLLRRCIDVFGIYAMWIVLHYIAANLYPHYCANLSFFGFFKSPFEAPTPQCQALRFLISTGGSFINNMWVAVGTYMCSKMCTDVFKRKKGIMPRIKNGKVKEENNNNNDAADADEEEEDDNDDEEEDDNDDEEDNDDTVQ